MTGIFTVAALTVAMSAFASGQTRNKPAAPGQAGQELIALSRKAVDDCT